ncbi:MAG TPA: hypothetical protein VFU54_08640 [Actinomycetota bacterium]|nr:hypothetical protein [Actinomycetota bacterium]
MNWDPDGYWRAIGAALIEFGLIVILGAGFNQVLQASADARTAATEDRAKRLEFLRRLRLAHVEMAHSQKLMRMDATSPGRWISHPVVKAFNRATTSR